MKSAFACLLLAIAHCKLTYHQDRISFTSPSADSVWTSGEVANVFFNDPNLNADKPCEMFKYRWFIHWRPFSKRIASFSPNSEVNVNHVGKVYVKCKVNKQSVVSQDFMYWKLIGNDSILNQRNLRIVVRNPHTGKVIKKFTTDSVNTEEALKEIGKDDNMIEIFVRKGFWRGWKLAARMTRASLVSYVYNEKLNNANDLIKLKGADDYVNYDRELKADNIEALQEADEKEKALQEAIEEEQALLEAIEEEKALQEAVKAAVKEEEAIKESEDVKEEEAEEEEEADEEDFKEEEAVEESVEEADPTKNNEHHLKGRPIFIEHNSQLEKIIRKKNQNSQVSLDYELESKLRTDILSRITNELLLEREGVAGYWRPSNPKFIFEDGHIYMTQEELEGRYKVLSGVFYALDDQTKLKRSKQLIWLKSTKTSSEPDVTGTFWYSKVNTKKQKKLSYVYTLAKPREGSYFEIENSKVYYHSLGKKHLVLKGTFTDGESKFKINKGEGKLTDAQRNRLDIWM